VDVESQIREEELVLIESAVRRASASRTGSFGSTRYYVISIEMTSWSDFSHEEFLSYYFSFITATIMNLKCNYNGTISEACRLLCFTQTGESFDDR